MKECGELYTVPYVQNQIELVCDNILRLVSKFKSAAPSGYAENDVSHIEADVKRIKSDVNSLQEKIKHRRAKL